jgi:acyl-CoA reductase-like NAD-dependent aldehyde dehydrogenase
MGARVSSVLKVDNPFTGKVVFEAPLLRRDQVDGIMARSQLAHAEWRRSSIRDRIHLVERFISEFDKERARYAREISEEMGKPLVQADREISTMFDRARQMATISESALAQERLPSKDGFERFISHEPVGVVVVMAAWNYPLLIAVNPMVAAILAGNSVIIKHSSRTPRSGEQFQEAFARAGAPKDLVIAVLADHAVMESIVQHPLTGYVSFTGSVAGGRQVYRAVADKRFIDVGLELGGKDPAYVASDAAFDYTVAEVIDGAFYNSGQSCCAVERVYVDESIYDRFLEASVAAIRGYKMGDPMAKDTTLGPMAQPSAPSVLRHQVEDAKQKGARVLLGGSPTSVGGQGRFFEPTLVADTDHRMAIAVEESFGPVLAIQRVESDDEAIRLMNDSPYGLTASVWTTDIERGKRITDQLDAGTVYVNRCDYLDPLLAWTGVKDSGKGVSLSRLGFHSVTRPKSHHLKIKL